MLEFSIWSDGKCKTYARGRHSVGVSCCTPEDPFDHHKGAKIAALRSVVDPVIGVPPDLLTGPQKILLLIENDDFMVAICSLNLEIGYNLATYGYYSLSHQLEEAARKMSVEFHVTAPARIFASPVPTHARNMKKTQHQQVAQMSILEKIELYPHLLPQKVKSAILTFVKKKHASSQVQAIIQVRNMSHDIELADAKDFVDRYVANL